MQPSPRESPHTVAVRQQRSWVLGESREYQAGRSSCKLEQSEASAWVGEMVAWTRQMQLFCAVGPAPPLSHHSCCAIQFATHAYAAQQYAKARAGQNDPINDATSFLIPAAPQEWGWATSSEFLTVFMTERGMNWLPASVLAQKVMPLAIARIWSSKEIAQMVGAGVTFLMLCWVI